MEGAEMCVMPCRAAVPKHRHMFSTYPDVCASAFDNTSSHGSAPFLRRASVSMSSRSNEIGKLMWLGEGE